jgi:flagellar basal-body rod protein FlgG
MIRALYTAASGMQAQQTNLDTIANNLSNSSTAGFQSRRMQFQDLIYQNIIMPGSAASQQTTVATGLQVGLGTRASASEILQLQGDLGATGNPLDMAIEGQGLFQVLLPTGETAYTRGGAFHQDAQGNVVTAAGNPLQPAVSIPAGATSITIASDGTVSVTLAGQTAAQQVGSIQLALFPNPGGLNSVGQNLYLATTASGDPALGTPGGADGLGQIEQGYLEQSNVSVVDEFINMIVAQRSYEASSRVVDAANQMFQLVNQMGK